MQQQQRCTCCDMHRTACHVGSKQSMCHDVPAVVMHSNSHAHYSLVNCNNEQLVWFATLLQALEPFFSVLLSAIFLGDSPTVPIVLSLFPIVGGVAMASVTEATFNWGGFLSAMGSNITFQSRNVLSKKFMGKDTKVQACNNTAYTAAGPSALLLM